MNPQKNNGPNNTISVPHVRVSMLISDLYQICNSSLSTSSSDLGPPVFGELAKEIKAWKCQQPPALILMHLFNQRYICGYSHFPIVDTGC